MLLNTAYAAEGEHEIIVYFGEHCTHEGDKGEETKYDDYPNGTEIFVDATLEHFLPEESTPIESIPVSGTVIVTTGAAPPIWLGSISVRAAEPQVDASDTTTSSSTTTGRRTNLPVHRKERNPTSTQQARPRGNHLTLTRKAD